MNPNVSGNVSKNFKQHQRGSCSFVFFVSFFLEAGFGVCGLFLRRLTFMFYKWFAFFLDWARDQREARNRRMGNKADAGGGGGGEAQGRIRTGGGKTATDDRVLDRFVKRFKFRR